ncbi:MAG TPA: multicopper oxidase domain-containing protein [bacterium]|jgi:zinc transporter ZupT|nr:multicopper oxidase domain-containing protein [bacterium]
MNLSTLFLLGFIAGGTILIGLPIGRLKGFNPTLRAALSMLAAGILVFLLIEIMGQACGQTASVLRSVADGSAGIGLGLWMVLLLVGGFLVGLVGLVKIEQRMVRSSAVFNPQNLSLMIAVGIGLHNLSEGLAIGQAYRQGMAGLTISLIVGFALHNATEGFGIMGPMVKSGQQPTWGRIFGLAVIGGGPTFVGTLLGSLWSSTSLSVFVLAMAGGSLLYVLKELLHIARKETAQVAIMTTLALGFTVGWGTEVIADMAQSGPGTGVMDADGDKISAKSLDAGPKISTPEAAAEDQVANSLLYEKAMEPKVLADGTKEYDLTASIFPWQLFPGAGVNAWGYNGQVSGPLLRFKVGDRVQFAVTNNLPQVTTVHWHGLAVPNQQDGVPGVTQQSIPPGGQFIYRFTVTPQMAGTHLYHTHVNDDFQMDKGLHGVMIIDPAGPAKSPYDVDALYEIASFKIAGSDQENVFTLDGKACPEAPVLKVPLGSHVLIRLVNASAEERHVMHLHGYSFKIVALDGKPVAYPQEANTVNLEPSQTADIAFTATNPGNWMFHCHILDHLINPGPKGEGSETQIPDMGGLMTFVEVLPKSQIDQNYQAAGSVSKDPTCP